VLHYDVAPFLGYSLGCADSFLSRDLCQQAVFSFSLNNFKENETTHILCRPTYILRNVNYWCRTPPNLGLARYVSISDTCVCSALITWYLLYCWARIISHKLRWARASEHWKLLLVRILLFLGMKNVCGVYQCWEIHFSLLYTRLQWKAPFHCTPPSPNV
jgi:hypothetical protein